MEIVEFSFTLSCFCSHSFTRSLCYTRIYLACKKFWFMGFHVNDVLWRIRQTLKQNIFVENIMFGLYLIGFSFIFSSPPSLLNCCCCVSVFFCFFFVISRAHTIVIHCTVFLVHESLTDYKIIPLDLRIYHDFHGRVDHDGGISLSTRPSFSFDLEVGVFHSSSEIIE